MLCALRHHQHVEHDDRRQRQDHRPDADGPENVSGGKVLLGGNALLSGAVMRRHFILTIHKRPRDFFAYGRHAKRDVLKFRLAAPLAF